MPRTKQVEKEEDLDIKVQEKKETFVSRWFKDYAVNNESELRIISQLTARSAEEQFSLVLKSSNTEVYAVVFYATFLTILDAIKAKQKKYNNFTVQICNSINIGYTNNDNEDNEKVGNFMPIMEHIGINRNIIESDTISATKTTQTLIKWQELNIKSNVEFYKNVQETAFNTLINEYKVNLRTSEAIIPLFCIFMDNIINVLKMKFKEADGTDISEVSMNVLGLFDVYYSYNSEDNVEVIEFSPNITMKLRLKNDDIAYVD